MRISLLQMVLLSSFFAAAHLADVANEIDPACNCDHCSKTKDDKDSSSLSVVPLNKEDVDGNGSLEICARGRDLPDLSFPSVCHMLCHNRCTRFNVTVVIEGNMKRHMATAYRTNYYKLRDGPCKKS